MKLATLALIIMIGGKANAQFDIIAASEAGKLVNDKNTIFLAVVKAEDYAKVHIQNSVNLDVKSICKAGSIEGLLKSTTEVAQVLGKAGIDPAKTIIIYDNGKYVNAGYVYWALDYLGYSRIKILDGHMKAWREARLPVTKTPTKLKAITVTPKVNKSIFADYAYVKSKLKSSGTLIIDVSSAKEFSAGNIPGSKNVENKNFFSEETSKLKSKAEIEKVLSSNGITKDKEIILYCASSARAGTVYMILKSLGYKNLKVYEPGYNEWKTK
ncbi:MAG: rhodanese-like domain-containing protein [Bacteroidales bacterium]